MNFKIIKLLKLFFLNNKNILYLEIHFCFFLILNIYRKTKI